MKMIFQPIEDCVVVEQIESKNDMSDGGIILPDKINQRPIMAKVLAVGPGVKMDDGSRYPMMLKVGDIVAFPRKSGDHLLLDSKELIIIPERYVLVRIKED
jgi:chaperonin GroES